MARTKARSRIDQVPKLEPEIFLSEHRSICDILTSLEESKASSKSALMAAKSRGIDLKAYKMVQKWSRSERESVERMLTNALYYARLLDLGLFKQIDLFGDNGGNAINGMTEAVVATHKAWQAERDGYEAGKAADTLDNNPHAPGTEEHQRYVVGWHDGDATRKGAEARGEKTITPKLGSTKNPEDDDE